jgi:hypothetical protein
VTTHVDQTAGRQQAVEARSTALDALGGWTPEDSSGPRVALPFAVLAVAGEIAAAREVLERSGDDRVEQELTVVRGEIARTDTKASILLASVAIVAGPLAEQAGTVLRQPWPVAALAGVAALLVGIATWLLLDVVLPRLTGSSNANFLHYARCSRDELRLALGPDADRHGELIVLSGITEAKFRRLALAGLLLKGAGLLFVVTAALALTV